MNLFAQLTERAGDKLLIRDEQRQRSVTFGELARWLLTLEASLKILDGVTASARFPVEMSACHFSQAIYDCANRIDHGENCNLDRPNLTEGAALSGRFTLVKAEPGPNRSRAPGASRAQWKPVGTSIP
jgi:hypothetical protein